MPANLSSSLPLAFFGSIGPAEMVLLGIVALLLYGGDLPEVARTWGKHLTEFRRHINGVRDEFNAAIYAEPPRAPRIAYQPPITSTPAPVELQDAVVAAEGVAESGGAPPVSDVTA